MWQNQSEQADTGIIRSNDQWPHSVKLRRIVRSGAPFAFEQKDGRDRVSYELYVATTSLDNHCSTSVTRREGLGLKFLHQKSHALSALILRKNAGARFPQKPA